MRHVLLLALLCSTASAQVLSSRKLDAADPVLASLLEPSDRFAAAVADIGDLNGDGRSELAIGATFDDDGIPGAGAVYILFLNPDGSIDQAAKISSTQGNLGAPLVSFEVFGSAIAPLGDLDGDGVPDVAIGAAGTVDPDTGWDKGSVRIVFLNADGTVKSHVLIREDEGGFEGVLERCVRLGSSLANLGDLDGNGVTDLAVGAPGSFRAAFWVLFLNADGTVLNEVEHRGSLGATYGASLAPLGDLDGDGNVDVAVGLPNQPGNIINTGGAGEIQITYLDADGSILSTARIGQNLGGFTGALTRDDHFASSLACIGDVDGDGNLDLAAGAVGVDDYGPDHGVVWGLLLNADGTVKTSWRIAEGEGGFNGVLERADGFGGSLTALDDLDGDGYPELVVGALGDDAGAGYNSALDYGGAWLLFGCEQGPATVTQRDAAPNPSTYSLGPVRIGGTFDATVDVAASGHDFAFLFGFDSPVQVTLGTGPVLLCFDLGGRGEILGMPSAVFGPLARFTFPVANDGSYCGTAVCTQVLLAGFMQPYALTNAQDFVVGTY